MDLNHSLSKAQVYRRDQMRSASIGFTDFEEGSKSEIFRRCDAGASNENEY